MMLRVTAVSMFVLYMSAFVVAFVFHSADAFAIEPGTPFYKRYEHQLADANRDGFLSEEENQKSYAKHFPATDANSDGKLSLEEMCAKNGWYSCTQLGGNGDMSFKKIDANGDGSVSADEFGQGFIKKKFDTIDTNKDGKLSGLEICTSLFNAEHCLKNSE